MTSAVHTVNVRTLAEYRFEGGDLFADLNAIDRMQEGMRGHIDLQSRYEADFRAEVPVRLTCEVEGVTLCVQGRVDGLSLSPPTATVEEIKTTRLDPESIAPDDYPVHWAQAQIYAYIVSVRETLERVTVKLTYYNLSSAHVSFTRLYTASALRDLFYDYAAPYAFFLRTLEKWKQVSLPSVSRMNFPFDAYREGQREMAKNAYIALRDGKKLLIQAPTGIGKTAAALFPAIKALGGGYVETIFYITARTTGRKAAEDALERMRENGLSVRSVTISAKEKVCLMDEVRCNPEYCPYAHGYFDRHRAAREEAMRTQVLNREAIDRLAREYELCPFELSLELAELAEVVICDYNYVFDPNVRLRRFFDKRGSYALLIDEAHNLIDRAREMYSAELSSEDARALRRSVGVSDGRATPLYAALTKFLKAFEKPEAPEMREQPPESVTLAAQELTEAAKDMLIASKPYFTSLIRLYFDALNYVRVSDSFAADSHRALILPEGKRSRIRLWCWRPKNQLRAGMKRVRGTILFSATLSPIAHYASEMGLDENEGDALLNLPSPFPRENLCVLRMDIPTTYAKRADSVHRVARAIRDMALSKPGNYFACFPSHAYLNQAAELFESLYPDITVLKQRARMNDQERAEYLRRFVENPTRSMVAFAAMGGVFGEGIDLPGERLSGACIVGVGMPQLSFERDCLKTLLDDQEEEGFETAYVYPGIERVLQAAGRVIRTDTDRGVVLLIDERFREARYRRLLPRHWQVKNVAEDELKNRLAAFWRGEQP